MSALVTSPRIAAISENDDRYRVLNALQIGKILRGLIAHRALITAHASDHGAFFLTAILELDEDGGTLVCDYGVDAALTERLLSAPRLTFVTQLDNVRVQFSVSGATAENYEGAPAFRVAIPNVLTRLQRREYYRLKVPRGRALYCDVHALLEETNAASLRLMTLSVYDISCGGVALTGWPGWFLPRPGLELRDCGILLPDLGRVVVDLHVVHVQGTTGQGPDAGRFGCRFTNASQGVAMLVQRCINRVEREQRALM